MVEESRLRSHPEGPARRSPRKEFPLKKTAGFAVAILASVVALPSANATLVPRTVFAEEFGWVT
jgi:hypothetical protein